MSWYGKYGGGFYVYPDHYENDPDHYARRASRAAARPPVRLYGELTGNILDTSEEGLRALGRGAPENMVRTVHRSRHLNPSQQPADSPHVLAVLGNLRARQQGYHAVRIHDTGEVVILHPRAFEPTEEHEVQP